MSDSDTYLANEVGIWRYMDVARFLTLIYEKKLFFARLHELGDPWEGVWTRPASHQFVSRGDDPEYRRRLAREFNSLALISCWHENERESVAMWKLYVSGREGVALKTTVGRLIRVVAANWARMPTIGRVRYEDITYDPVKADYDGITYAAWFLFRKSKAYEHEREVRAVIYDPHYDEHAALQEATFAANRPAPRGEVGRGEAVPVDLSILIERIVVSPGFPEWALGSLQKAVDAASVGVQMESSGLLDQPCEDTLGAIAAKGTPPAFSAATT